MLIAGTVIADPETVIPDGAVVVEGETIAAVGDAEILREAYPDHERRDIDIVAPGLVGGHVHSVQSLGRGSPTTPPSSTGCSTPCSRWRPRWTPARPGPPPNSDTSNARIGNDDGRRPPLRQPRRGGVRGRDRDGDPRTTRKGADGPRLARGLLEDTDAALAESEALIEEYHGAADGRVRYAVTPRFAVTCSEACLRGCRDLVDRHDGVTIHTHASENEDEIETVEADTGKRNVLWLDEVGLTGPDVTLAHCVHTDEREREVLAETDTVVTHCPSSNMKLASGIAPVQDYLDRGITVALGNDGPPCNNTLDPFTEMRQASLLGKVDARDPTRLPASTVLEMATTNGAHAAGFDVSAPFGRVSAPT